MPTTYIAGRGPTAEDISANNLQIGDRVFHIASGRFYSVAPLYADCPDGPGKWVFSGHVQSGRPDGFYDWQYLPSDVPH